MVLEVCTVDEEDGDEEEDIIYFSESECLGSVK